MPLKNAYSESANTHDRIQKALASHGAKKLMFDYNDTGHLTGLAFQIIVGEQPLSIRLPARVENVAELLYGRPFSDLTESQQQQAYRTAWANIRDWIEAQLAMIDTKMVKMEEVFM